MGYWIDNPDGTVTHYAWPPEWGGWDGYFAHVLPIILVPLILIAVYLWLTDPQRKEPVA